ncbi:Methylmalonyl-CoA carboxyltransferase 1.3S subunit [termite gut metagenome]|uniref:Methylmalonyl-CoA carboxyltransferase 1.3S subunit n=1 Tax=termite gut metagenome TaxID=433724 RepID=A0A5J4T479_9ZZZZ
MKEYKYKIKGKTYNVKVNDVENNIAHVEVNGVSYDVELDKPVEAPEVKIEHPVVAPKKESTPSSRPVSAKKDGVKSPLPGVILDIRVNEGDVVKKGQTVVILEAMKMENTINAHKDGKVTAINVSKGDSVLEGIDLVIIE